MVAALSGLVVVGQSLGAADWIAIAAIMTTYAVSVSASAVREGDAAYALVCQPAGVIMWCWDMGGNIDGDPRGSGVSEQREYIL